MGRIVVPGPQWRFSRPELIYCVLAVFAAGLFLGRVIEDLIDPHIGKIALVLHLVPGIVFTVTGMWFIGQGKENTRVAVVPRERRSGGQSGGDGGVGRDKSRQNTSETVDADWSIISDDVQL